MAKNLVPEIAKMLGVALGEEFMIEGKPDYVLFRFEKNGVKVRNARREDVVLDRADAAIVRDLILGRRELIKMPWQPKFGEEYWTFDKSNASTCIRWTVGCFYWENSPFDIGAFKNNWVFHTQEEAEKALPAIAEEMGVYY